MVENNEVKINLSPQVPSIPRPEDKTKVDVRYMVIAPYVSIHIYWDEKKGELAYDVEEPVLKEEDKENMGKMEQAMREVINVNIVGERTEENLIEYIDKTARLIISELGLRVEEEAYKRIFYFFIGILLG